MKPTEVRVEREVEDTSEKYRIILAQTEQIETVMTFMEVEPELGQFQQATPRLPAEATCLQTGTLIVLWSFVLLAQLLLLWQCKKNS